MRVIGVGDNTVDQYLHLRRMFPGGNAVNVPVLVRRYGQQASYLGWLGDDALGRLLLDALAEEGVDTSHCRVMTGANAYCQVSLVDGDRVFGQSSAGVSRQIALTDADLAFIQTHDLVHTSVYSHIWGELPRLRQVAPQLSFDFSQGWKRERLVETLPYLTFAFLSSPDTAYQETVDLLRWVQAHGPAIVVVTQGKNGAFAFDGEQVYQQPIVETTVVDTLGAGDAFIARFLVEYGSGQSIEASMTQAAASAAETCGYYGAFGHGVEF